MNVPRYWTETHYEDGTQNQIGTERAATLPAKATAGQFLADSWWKFPSLEIIEPTQKRTTMLR